MDTWYLLWETEAWGHRHPALLEDLAPPLHGLPTWGSLALRGTLGNVWGQFWFPEMLLNIVQYIWALKLYRGLDVEEREA